MLTTFLSRADVSRNLHALRLLAELREALVAHTHAPPGVTLPLGAPAATVRAAALPGVPAFAVTTLTHPSRAFLQLHAADTGALLAVMDATHLLALRTALVGALATDVLARPEAKTVAVLGSGAAASSALKALRLVRSVEQVWLHDPDPAAGFQQAQRLQSTLRMAVKAVDSVAEAVAAADVVLLTGGAPLTGADLRPGTHVTVLAADAFQAPPLPAPLLSQARRFRDGPTPELAWGHPFHALLGEVLGGTAAGRTGPEERTLFAAVGPPWLDLLAAWHVHQGAKHDEALTRLDLEA